MLLFDILIILSLFYVLYYKDPRATSYILSFILGLFIVKIIILDAYFAGHSMCDTCKHVWCKQNSNQN
jgi:hypothetical protein